MKIATPFLWRRLPRRLAPSMALVAMSGLLILGAGCAKEKIVVAGTGDDDGDPQYQKHKQAIEDRIKKVDQDPRLTPEQKAQVKHDLIADGLAGHTKKVN